MKKINYVSKEVLTDAIHQIAKLTPDEINTFYNFLDLKTQRSGSLMYDTCYILMTMSPEKFFRKLADFIEFKKNIKK